MQRTVVLESVNTRPPLSVIESVNKSGRVLIVEEGSKIVGWGAEMASQIYEKCFPCLTKHIIRLGAGQTPIPSSKFQEDNFSPNHIAIENAIVELYNDKKS